MCVDGVLSWGLRGDELESWKGGQTIIVRNSYSHFTMDDKRRELKLSLETGYGVYRKAGQCF